MTDANVLGWSLPANLRWIDENRAAGYTPSGMLVGEVLRLAADRIENPISTPAESEYRRNGVSE